MFCSCVVLRNWVVTRLNLRSIKYYIDNNNQVWIFLSYPLTQLEIEYLVYIWIDKCKKTVSYIFKRTKHFTRHLQWDINSKMLTECKLYLNPRLSLFCICRFRNIEYFLLSSIDIWDYGWNDLNLTFPACIKILHGWSILQEKGID